MALAAARHGADIVIHHAHSPEDAETLAEEINSMGRHAWIIQCDLEKPECAQNLIHEAFSYRTLYAVINNAAVFHPQIWQDTSVELWKSTLDLNLTAPFLITQAFAELLPQDLPGRVINILDWRALRPGADHFAYTVSKAALAALTRSFAQALAPRINVNALALGAMLPPSDGVADPNLINKIPLKRWGSMDDLEHAILFLLDGPDEITGTILQLDGGRHLI